MNKDDFREAFSTVYQTATTNAVGSLIVNGVEADGNGTVSFFDGDINTNQVTVLDHSVTQTFIGGLSMDWDASSTLQVYGALSYSKTDLDVDQRRADIEPSSILSRVVFDNREGGFPDITTPGLDNSDPANFNVRALQAAMCPVDDEEYAAQLSRPGPRMSA